MDFSYIITIIAYNIAGIIISIILPFTIKRYINKHLKKKIDEVSETEELKKIKEELIIIKREILTMRGKIK